MSLNPLDVFVEEVKEFQSHFEGNESDFKLIYQYFLMPIFDVSSPHDLEISQQQRDRLYYLLKTHSEALSKLLRTLGYECFFAELDAFHAGNASYQSRHRPQVIGDDTKQAKGSACVMEYLAELFCPAEGKKLPCYNLVVLIATFGNTKWEIPLDIRLWLPKRHPRYISKPKILKQMVEALHAEAKERDISLAGVFFSCDAAYQRSHKLLQAVAATQMTLLVKVSGNMTFTVNGKSRKAKNIRKYMPYARMKSCSRLGLEYKYKRIAVEHPKLGAVLLIVSARYDAKHKKWRRILLMTTDLSLQAPRAIVLYGRRWRVELFFKTMKQQLRLGLFQLRRLPSIRSHFTLRGLGYLLLNIVRRRGFMHQTRWSIRKVKRWLRDVLDASCVLKAA